MVRISHFTFTQKTIFHFAPNVFLHTCSQALKASLQIPLLCWFLSIRFIKFWLKYRWSLVKKKRRISRVALVYDSSPLCCALSQLALLPHHLHLRPSSFSFWYFSPLWTQLSQPECHRWWQCQGRGFVRWRTRDDDRIFASEEEIKENCPQVNNCWGSAADPGDWSPAYLAKTWGTAVEDGATWFLGGSTTPASLDPGFARVATASSCHLSDFDQEQDISN